MAHKEQVERLKRSVQEWNVWRQEHREIRLDLIYADLSSIDLTHVDLSFAYLVCADLHSANLCGADLRSIIFSGAKLGSANLSDADLFNATLIKTDFSEAYLIRAHLSEANLSGAKLSGADLSFADLTHANLNGANLSGAKLSGADLSDADLSDAYFSGANLSEANLSGANLSGANFNRANLSRANLSDADLSDAKFNETDLTKAHFSYTTFTRVNLSRVKGLETAIHDGPSTVGTNSVQLPTDEHTRNHFLCGVGLSGTVINYHPSSFTIPVQYHSLFLSYSHHDQAFAKRLYNDLQNQGVRCWFAPHDLRPGTPLIRSIEEAIHGHEKLLLILSTDAVMSNWVQQEVETALHKEVITSEEILFPIRLDDAVLESDTIWAKRLRQRHIGDFTGWQDDTAYQQAFTTLLRHLKMNTPPTL